MRPKANGHRARRQPKQQRGRRTVDAVLDASIAVLKREGIDGVTTNRIAEVAGVSIGSLYQYFCDKHAIFVALHERHIQEMGRLIETTRATHAAEPFAHFVRAMMEGLIEAHENDSAVHELLMAQIPHGGDRARGLELRFHDGIRIAVSTHAMACRSYGKVESALLFLPHMVESLTHGAIAYRRVGLPRATAHAEAVRAVLAHLRWDADTLRCCSLCAVD